MCCRTLKGALIPVSEGIPGLHRTSRKHVLIEYRNAGFRLVQVRNKGCLHTGILCRAHAGQIRSIFAAGERDFFFFLHGAAVIRSLYNGGNRSLSGEYSIIRKGSRRTGDCRPLGGMRTGGFNILILKIQPDFQAGSRSASRLGICTDGVMLFLRDFRGVETYL